ncbi:hypothetical protein BH09PAT4_BH09PAT4_01020 [soil metagenome]
MERDNYNPYTFESSGESSDEKKNDKKKSKSAEGLGRLVAREEREREESPKTEQKDDRSFLQKIAGELPKSETRDTQKTEETVDDNHEMGQEVPLESVSAGEQVEVAEAHIGERSKELVAESEGDQTQEQTAETVANAAFLDAVQERLARSSDVTVEEAIDIAYDEITVELGVDDTLPSPEDEDEDELPVDEQADAGESAAETEPQDLDPDHAVPLAAGGATPPTPPIFPRPSQASPGDGNAPRHIPAAADISKPGATPNRLSSADAAYYERRGVARGLLVGGVVGYLIGRRRGRIKTEKRMQVVQQKLEKQVSEIHQKIEQKELVIRKLARQNVPAAVALAPRLAERTVRSEVRPTEVTANNEALAARERQSTPERAGTVKAIERAETAKAAVDSLSKEELLAYSAQIRVGETNLRRVFEANMVDEKGLRRLIKEYQAGHDLRRALAREFMVKELKFERDPTLRDLLPPEVQPRRQGKNNEGQNQYGEGAATAVVDHIAQQIAAAGKSSETLSPAAISARASQAKRRQANVSSGVLIGLTLVTVGLAIYAVWLTLNK